MVDAPIAREAAESAARANGLASMWVPGLGQAAQGRYGTALLHFCSTGAYVVVALRAGHFWSIGAVLFNLWSVIDAVWWARGAGVELAPEPRGSDATSTD